MNIPLSSPDLDEHDIEAVVSVLRTPQLSLGPKLPEFEHAFAAYIGTAHAVALSSGTAGLELSLCALGVQAGDDVVIPSFAFIAVANVVRHIGARPVFAEIDPISLNLTAESIQRVLTNQTRGIIVVHTFGVPADMQPILDLCRRRKLFVIEDACEAIGAEYRGCRVGSFGDVAVFSFYPNKPMTTGEGGLVVTPNATIAARLKALRNQGRAEHDGWLEHSLLGYNYRLSEINCALGISQLKKIERILARREAVAGFYFDVLKDCPDLVLPTRGAPQDRISWFAFVIRMGSHVSAGAREHLQKKLTAAGIGCRPYFPPIHCQPLYAEYAPKALALAITVEVAQRTLALPFFNALNREQVGHVATTVRQALADFKT